MLYARPHAALGLLLLATLVTWGCGGVGPGPGGNELPLPSVSIVTGPEALTNQRRAELLLECDTDDCRMECDLNGTGWLPCASPLIYEELADREHLVWVRGRNADDLFGERAEWAWKVDTQMPLVIGLRGPPSPTNETAADFVFSCSKVDCSYECSLTGGDYEACDSGLGLIDLVDGEHRLSVRAEDPAGNVGQPALWTWTVDTLEPLVTGLIGPPDPTNLTTAGFGYSCSKDECAFTCVLDGELQEECEPGYHYGGQTGPSRLTEGPHQFAVSAVDAVGNAGPASVWSWTVDTTAPSVTDLAGPEDPTTHDQAELTFGCSEVECRFSCRLEGAAQGLLELDDSCAGAVGFDALADDEYTFTVVATDPAGNQSLPAIWIWTVDTAAPAVQGLTGPPDPTNATEAAFTFACSKAECTFACELRGVNQGTVSAEAACVSGVAYVDLLDDDYSFTVVAADPLGTQGSLASWSWRLDTVVPEVMDLQGPPDPTNSEDAAFSFGCSKEQCSFTCRLSAAGQGAVSAEMPCQSGVEYLGLGRDVYTFTVVASDPAGNQSNATSWTWTLDNVLPVVVITSAPAQETWQTSASFEFSCINKDDCVFECAVDEEPDSGTWVIGGWAPCSSPHLVSDLVPGAYLFRVRGTDGAGNVGLHHHPWSVIAFEWAVFAAGRDHSCGIVVNGSLWCWGDNSVGKLGDGTATGRSSPVRVGSATDWATISLGANHSCGIRADGSLWCWGSNWAGQLGDGTTYNSAYPIRVSLDLDWEQVSAGYAHTCGRRTDGSLWCWGKNSDGRLGDGTGTDRPAPAQVGSSLDWLDVTAGTTHTCGSLNPGSLWCWGANWSGQLGDGTTTASAIPVQVGSFVDWTGVFAGEDHACGTRGGGSLWCWGTNWSGQLGDGTISNRSSPVQVGVSLDWEEVSLGLHHSCGKRAGGSLWCWGANGSGQLGDGTSVDRSTPTRVGTAEVWDQVASGGWHTCSARADKTLWCWGDNQFGQLGDDTTEERLHPVEVLRP